MFKKVNHIGIVVSDLDQAMEDYRDGLGLVPAGTHDLPERGLRLAFFPVGESQIELLQSLDPDSGVSRFLEKRGEGIHHLCLEVDDIYAALEELRAKGVPLIDETPQEVPAGLIAFVHPKGMHGVLLELLQAREEVTLQA